MPVQRITKRTVDAAESAAASYLIRDANLKGFCLVVTPAGGKSYAVDYRAGHGRHAVKRRLVIGKHGSPWTPDGARNEAKRLLGLVADGQDPAAVRKAEARRMTFSALCDLYLAEGTAHKKPRTLAADRGRINHHLKPLLGSKRIDEISRAAVERLMRDVMAGKTAAPKPKKGERKPGSLASGGKGVAAQCVALVSTVLSFAVARGLLDANPAKGVKKPPTRKMERFLSEAEIGRLAEVLTQCESGWTKESAEAWCQRMGDEALAAGRGKAEADEIAEACRPQRLTAEPPYAIAALRLLLLTGCRRSEIVNLQWSWVDFERAIISLPDSKTGRKSVYLSAPALAVLAALPRQEGNPHVICGYREGAALVGLDKSWDRIRKVAGLAGVRVHDLRHSFASIGAAGGMGLPIVGKLLGHSQSATTARYAHLADDPVRRAAEAIGERIKAAMERKPGANVIPLPTPRATG